MIKKYIEIDTAKKLFAPFIPETEEGTKIIQDVMSATVDLDDGATNSEGKTFEEMLNAAKADWEAERAREKAEWEAENAKRWIAAWGTGVTEKENPKAVEQTGATDPQVTPTENPPTESFWGEYTKEGAMTNALYS